MLEDNKACLARGQAGGSNIPAGGSPTREVGLRFAVKAKAVGASAWAAVDG
jgi:hypothetical protein